MYLVACADIVMMNIDISECPLALVVRPETRKVSAPNRSGVCECVWGKTFGETTFSWLEGGTTRHRLTERRNLHPVRRGPSAGLPGHAHEGR